MTDHLTSTGRATLALAAARGLTETKLAGVLGVDPATLSRKKNGRSSWNDADALRAVDALGEGIDPLIRDLERLRATRQYQAPTTAATATTGQGR